MKIDVLASSSAGNAYLVRSGDRALLIEAGLPMGKLVDALGAADCSLSRLSGLLVSHGHGDHARAAGKIARRAVSVYASEGTLRELGLLGHHRAHALSDMEVESFDGWSVIPFDVEHDADEPMGFVIRDDKTGKRLLYVTDTGFVTPRFSGLTHVLVGTNYSEKILSAAQREGRLDADLASRIRRSHMSLETAIEMLKSNDLSAVDEIHLLHLSDAHSDEGAFRQAVEAATGCPVYIAAR